MKTTTINGVQFVNAYSLLAGLGYTGGSIHAPAAMQNVINRITPVKLHVKIESGKKQSYLATNDAVRYLTLLAESSRSKSKIAGELLLSFEGRYDLTATEHKKNRQACTSTEYAILAMRTLKADQKAALANKTEYQKRKKLYDEIRRECKRELHLLDSLLNK